MTIKDKILENFIQAIKNKDQTTKNILGNIKTQIVLFEKNKNITDDDILSMIQKEIKKLESIIDVK